jgi:hypothetical protein
VARVGAGKLLVELPETPKQGEGEGGPVRVPQPREDSGAEQRHFSSFLSVSLLCILLFTK